MLLLLFSLASARQACKWTDPQGEVYDFTHLDRPGGWHINDQESDSGMFGMVYIFNFCDFSEIRCHDRLVAVYEALSVMGQITSNCDIVGTQLSQKISLIDGLNPSKGIEITYSDGELCMEKPGGAMEPRKGIFQIECAENGRNDETFSVIPGSECVDRFKIRHSAGCKAKSSKIKKALEWFFIIFTVYMVVRFIYNRKKLDLDIMESIPHLEMWKLILSKTASLLQELIQKLKLMSAKRSQNYSTI